MNKKNLVKVNKNAIIATVIGLVLLVGGVGLVKAGLPFWDKVAQYAGIGIVEKMEVSVFEDLTVGAFPGPDVYEEMRFHDGFLGEASFQIDLNFQQATSAADNNVADQATELLVGSYKYNGTKDLLCNTVAIDISTANGLFAYDLKMGTSTSATSSDAHLITETDDGNAIGTTTTDILNKEDDEGTSTDEIWVMTAGEYFVITQTFQAANATSSDSFTTAGGNATVGKAFVNCWYRYDNN